MRQDQSDVLEKDVLNMSLELTAKTNDETGEVWIDGDKATKKLEKGTPPTTFEFTLKNKTKPKLTVAFSSLDAQDNVQCPPASGSTSEQITSVVIGTDTASFVDQNNNTSPMTVCYQWNFTCSDGQTPAFDPVIDNRGR